MIKLSDFQINRFMFNALSGYEAYYEDKDMNEATKYASILKAMADIILDSDVLCSDGFEFFVLDKDKTKPTPEHILQLLNNCKSIKHRQ